MDLQGRVNPASPRMSQNALAEYLEVQRQLYLAALPEKIEHLQLALAAFVQRAEAESCTVALGLAHKLTGSGGTFGFPQVSEAAGAIERVLDQCQTARGWQLGPAEADVIGNSLAVLRSVVAGAQASVTAASSTAVKSRKFRQARHIDVIESDPDVAANLVRQIQQSGYRAQVFASPSQFAARATGVVASAILANLNWPAGELAALQAGTHVDAGEPTPVPVIFMAESTDFSSRLAAVRAGGVGYFLQPLDVPALVSVLNRITSDEPSKPYRVLIVEDDEALASFYAEVLRAADMVTSVVTDPTAVLAELATFQPDLITCDIHMPECNGIELAALIRQQEEFIRIPIVFLSTETSLDKQSLALKQGGDDFIIKPVNAAHLISAAQSRARRYRSLLAAEDTLRISEERFRLVVETSLDGFIQTLFDGTIVSANQAACHMFDMTEQDLCRVGLTGIADPADPRLKLLQAIATSGTYRGELTCIRRSGQNFPAEISASQHISRSGDAQCSIIVRDITERKVAEQNILQLNAELEARVVRRTASLTAANQELQAFSHSLAHDLRQPYIAINGLTSLLERDMAAHLTPRSKDYLNRIRAGVTQMNDRTDSLLSLAQLSQTTTQLATVDLSALCNSILAHLRAKEPGRRVQTDVQSPLNVHGDATLLTNLLVHLLGNAWKFTSKRDDALIRVSCEHTPDGPAVYCIADNGAGFEMAYVDKLFGAFQRLHSPTEFSGPGMGLAMARRIVTRHGGSIWAESVPDQGASFYFTLGTSLR